VQQLVADAQGNTQTQNNNSSNNGSTSKP